MRAVIVGSVESSRVAIEAVARAPGWTLPLVVTLPLSLARRHSDHVDLRPAAEAAGARVIDAPDVNAPDICMAIRDAAPDHVFVIGWSQICREPFMQAAGGGTIGYHPAPLPRMRGRAVIPWTILNEEPITGGTLFWI
ncbi:MAG: formyltransferase family protein, partial [Sphingobium sp.]